MWKRRILRFLMPTAVFLIACAFQTTAWPALFGSVTPPPLWLLVILWLSLYRPRPATIMLLYFLGFLACSFTAMPLKMMLFSILILHTVITIARGRVFWSGPGYFVLASVAGVAFFHVIYVALSWVLEPVPAAWLPLERLSQILLAAPFSAVIFTVMEFLERPIAAENALEAGGVG